MISSTLNLAVTAIRTAPKEFTINDLIGQIDFSLLTFARSLIIGLVGALVGIGVLTGVVSGLVNTSKIGFSAGNNNEMRTSSGIKGVKMSVLAIALTVGFTTIAFVVITVVSGISKLV